MNKKDVRKNVLAVRDAIPAEDRARYDASIRESVMGTEEYREADVILAYVSYKSEVDTTSLIRQALADGKNVFAPKVSGSEMEFWRISSLEDLREGYRGIREPIQSVAFSDWIFRHIGSKVMMWMPGVAFDKERHRIGYGGGFYDRYLTRLLQQSEQTDSTDQAQTQSGGFILTTAALAYSCQVLDRIPYEEHDVKPDLLVTEQEGG
ncbi:MAG: 5-formyltetrahydrofolate cyclo-ligase [Lachnospiraceae bacterium]|nr:5-formyltetrahydrofolate cyclo-ligase [Lachnospiraceae bacterium]